MSPILSMSRVVIEKLLQEIMFQSNVPKSVDGIVVPDGRPLYLYRLDQKTFETCGQFLRKALEEYHKYGNYNRPIWLSGLLVFYGAHWFRRESNMTMQRWSSLDILPNDFNTWERGRLIQDGLKFWQLKVYHSGRDRRWLHTLALNGGIPARLLSASGKNWFREFFKAIVSDQRSSEDISSLSDNHV